MAHKTQLTSIYDECIDYKETRSIVRTSMKQNTKYFDVHEFETQCLILKIDFIHNGYVKLLSLAKRSCYK